MSQRTTPDPLYRPPRRVRRMLGDILGRYLHFDVVELYLNSGAPGLPIEELDALCGGGATGVPRSPPLQPAWKYHVVMQQPSQDALHLLAASLGSHRVLITKVEVTLDLRVESKKRARKLQWAILSMMAVKSWKQQVVAAQGTLYFGRRHKAAYGEPESPEGDPADSTDALSPTKRQHRAAPQNYVIYVRRGKSGGPFEDKRVLRLEARLRGKAAIDAADITTVQCLIDFDHTQFWLSRVRLLVPPSLAEAGAQFGTGKAKVSRTMLTRRGHAWREQFLVDGHFCMQNAVLAHRGLWTDLDDRWTSEVLLGRESAPSKPTL